MKPFKIITIAIYEPGERQTNEVVLSCIEKNTAICMENNVPYQVVCCEPVAGIERSLHSELLRFQYLSEFENLLYIDWDFELKTIPDFVDTLNPNFALWVPNPSRIDAFFAWSGIGNHELLSNISNLVNMRKNYFDLINLYYQSGAVHAFDYNTVGIHYGTRIRKNG